MVTWQSDICPFLKQNICSLVIVLYNAFVLDTSDFTLPEVTHCHFIEVFSRTRKWWVSFQLGTVTAVPVISRLYFLSKYLSLIHCFATLRGRFQMKYRKKSLRDQPTFPRSFLFLFWVAIQRLACSRRSDSRARRSDGWERVKPYTGKTREKTLNAWHRLSKGSPVVSLSAGSPSKALKGLTDAHLPDVTRFPFQCFRTLSNSKCLVTLLF